MTSSERKVVRPDARGRVTLPQVDPGRDYAVDQLPGGAYIVSPCSVVTDFEAWLEHQVPEIDVFLDGDGTAAPSWEDIQREAHQP